MHRWKTTFRTLGLLGLTAGGAVAGFVGGGAGCTHRVDVQPIRVEPIHLTVDVNVRLDRELQESFGFEERIERQLESGATTSTTTTTPPPDSTPATTAPQGGAQ